MNDDDTREGRLTRASVNLRNVLDITIESDVPIPVSTLKFTGITGALRTLQIGDSFRVKATEVSASFQQTVHRYALRCGIRLATRTEREKSGTYIRVWRVE